MNTLIKFCGLTRPLDIEAANEILPDYVGFVFAKKSKRFVEVETARGLRSTLDGRIRAVGVFVDAEAAYIADILNQGIIDIAQLHGSEDCAFVRRLRGLTDRMIIQAFTIRTREDAARAKESLADMILLDAGAGHGRTFDWDLIKGMDRPYILAGGLDPHNVGDAVALLSPYGVDVSSGIETDGIKDRSKMAAFANAVRKGRVDGYDKSKRAFRCPRGAVHT